jgi:hypothetical protein
MTSLINLRPERPDNIPVFSPAVLNLFGVNLARPNRGPEVPVIDPLSVQGSKASVLSGYFQTGFHQFLPIEEAMRWAAEIMKKEKAPSHLGVAYEWDPRSAWSLHDFGDTADGYSKISFNQHRDHHAVGLRVDLFRSEEKVVVRVTYGDRYSSIIHEAARSYQKGALYNRLEIDLTHASLKEYIPQDRLGLSLYMGDLSLDIIFSIVITRLLLGPSSMIDDPGFLQTGFKIHELGHVQDNEYLLSPENNFALPTDAKINDRDFRIDSVKSVFVEGFEQQGPFPAFFLRHYKYSPERDDSDGVCGINFYQTPDGSPFPRALVEMARRVKSSVDSRIGPPDSKKQLAPDKSNEKSDKLLK